jgi:hypothetical protein
MTMIKKQIKQEHESQDSSSRTIAEETPFRGGARYRIIDWARSLATSTGLLVLSVYSLLAVGSQPNRLWLACPVVLFATFVSATFVQFRGVVFDQSQNTLTFPILFSSRTIPLSEIRDANCHLYGHFTLPGMSDPTTGKNYRGKKITKHVVNVSGPFGVRKLRFWSLARRDEFLSELKALVPTVRITRWSGRS